MPSLSIYNAIVMPEFLLKYQEKVVIGVANLWLLHNFCAEPINLAGVFYAHTLPV